MPFFHARRSRLRRSLLLPFTGIVLCWSTSLIGSEVVANADTRCEPRDEIGQMVRQHRLSRPLQAIQIGSDYLKSNAADLSRAIVAFDVAFAHGDAGQFDAAFALIENYLPVVTDSQHQACIAHAYSAIGAIYNNAEDYEDAFKWNEMALALRQRIGDEERVAGSLNNIGLNYLYLHQIELAEESFTAALAIWENVQRADKAALALSNLAQVDLASGRLEQSLQRQHEALRVFEQNNEVYAITEAKLFIAKTLLAMQQPAQALPIAQEAETLAANQHLRPLYNQTRLVVAQALHDMGRIAQAQLILEQQVAELDDSLQPRAKHDAYALLVALYQQHNNSNKALLALQHQYQLSQKLFSRLSTIRMSNARINFIVTSKQQEIERLTHDKQVAELAHEQQQSQMLIWFLALGGIVAVVVSVYSIRQHRRELLRQQQVSERLSELDKLKNAVLANTSHELRTPLNGIIGLSELIQQSAEAEEVRNFAALILDSGHRLNAVVDDLLTYSQLANNALMVQLSVVDVPDLLDDVCRHFEWQCIGKKLLLAQHYQPSLPPVRADAERLRQVLYNLLSNAVKFTEKGAITIDAVAQDDVVKFSISDTGIGIDAEKQARIFLSFEQADANTSRRFQGLGLGLAICQALIEKMSGKIGVMSTPGIGSTFWFTLPIASAHLHVVPLAN